MPGKPRQVHLRVTDTQHEAMRAKAASYGITLTRLVLLSVEAYVRTYDTLPAEGAFVAVNYGAWCRADDGLATLSDAVRDAARQLAAVRRALPAGGLDAIDAVAAVSSCRDELLRVREAVERSFAILDRVADGAHLADPYLGPFESDAGAD